MSTTATISISDFKAAPAKFMARASRGDRIFLRNNRKPQQTIQLVPVRTVYVPPGELEVVMDDFTKEEFEVFAPSIKNFAK
jgi:hypothetical protein